MTKKVARYEKLIGKRRKMVNWNEHAQEQSGFSKMEGEVGTM
jgi:hypothetical protein